ncbi:MAG: GNAT family N-acetyltransferase [Clostridiales bacterium]|nr:GNAT family N-acetyltransferase [Clostridiales bacterium]
MEIIEYTNEYTEEIKDMLVGLQNHIAKIDDFKLNIMTNEYREEYFKFAYKMNIESGGKFFIAKENDEVLGFIACSITEYEDIAKVSYKCPKKGVITELFVKETARRKGVANALILKAEEYLKSINCEFVELDVFANNKNAYKLYKRNNFNERVISMLKKLK